MTAATPDGSRRTRRSLISRLRNWDDQESWKEFFNTYWKLIYSVAIKAGLSDQEAEDVVQDTVLSVARKMDTFQYDRAVCSFKGWLLHVTRLRIIDQFRKRPPPLSARPEASSNESRRTPHIERIPDPASLTLDSVWEEEWKKNIVDAAMERVKQRVRPDHYQIFYLNAVKKLPARKVASMVGVNIAQVYVVKQRMVRLIKREIKFLESQKR